MISLTAAAAEKAAALLDAQGLHDLYALRVAVQPGGCSGLRYQLFFDDRTFDGDETLAVPTAAGDLRVVVDRFSLPYLDGAVIDFADTIAQQGFTVDNPNASGSCSCGDSFH